MTDPITAEEFSDFEVLLGALLDEVSDQEMRSLLHIHRRLENMLKAQVSQAATLERLKRRHQET